jgi:hypothetical protein
MSGDWKESTFVVYTSGRFSKLMCTVFDNRLSWSQAVEWRS